MTVNQDEDGIDLRDDIPTHVFDGFCHRPFDEGMDGWMRNMPKEIDYPSVQAARETLHLFDELKAAKYRIWELEKENERMKEVLHWK
jgi:hypothetical protein